MIAAGIPGLPFFTYGRSASYAWGVTALNPDTMDLYVEKINGDKYFYDDQWHDLKIDK